MSKTYIDLLRAAAVQAFQADMGLGVNPLTDELETETQTAWIAYYAGFVSGCQFQLRFVTGHFQTLSGDLALDRALVDAAFLPDGP